MTQSTQQSEAGSHLLEARVDNARVLSAILKTINFRPIANVYATSLGLKIVVEQHQTFQANAFLQASLFHRFDLKEEQVSFKINLSILLECLSIFGSNPLSSGTLPTLRIRYDGYGEPVVLLIEEAGIVTDCSLKTMDCDLPLDFDFTSSDLNCKIILRSDVLRDMFNDMDHKSETVEIFISPDCLRLTTWSDSGDNSTEISSDSPDVEKFECMCTQSYRYQTSLLRLCNKSLTAGRKASLRIDKRGFISLQVMIYADESQPSFIDFLCVPDEEYDNT